MTSQKDLNAAMDAIGRTNEEQPKNYGWNAAWVDENCPMRKALDGHTLDTYPGGIREALKKFFQQLGYTIFNTQETKELLAAIRTDGFKHIPSRVITEEHGPCASLDPDTYLQHLGEHLDYLSATIHYLLDKVDPPSKEGYAEDMTTGERVVSPMEKTFNDIVPEDLAEIQKFWDAHPSLRETLNTAQLSVPQIVEALRESSLTVPAQKPTLSIDMGNCVEETQLEEGVDPLDHLISRVTEAWNSGADILTIEGLGTLRGISKNIDIDSPELYGQRPISK